MTESRRLIRRRTTRRGRLLFFTALVLIGLSVLGAWSKVTQKAPVTYGVSVIAPTSSESSNFTCGGFTEGGGSEIPGKVVLTNSTNVDRVATLNIVDNVGHRGIAVRTVPASSSLSVNISVAVTGGTVVGAQVGIDGGGVAVTEQIDKSGEASATPCASSVSPTWTLAGGSTDAYHHLTYTVMNPTATTAVVNATFLTSSGLVTPQPGQGVVVPPHGLALIVASDLVPHQPVVAGMVNATRGAVVTFATQLSPSPSGRTVTLASPGVAQQLVLARGVATPGATTALVVANPSSSSQLVTVTARIASGALSPWTQVVAPHGIWVLPTTPSSRIPLTDVFSLQVSAKGTGVFASYVVTALKAQSGALGLMPLTEPPVMQAGSWLLPAARAPRPLGLSVTSAATSPVTVHVVLVTPAGDEPVAGLDGQTLSPGASLVASPAELIEIGSRPLRVSSSGPVAVSEDLAGGSVPGTATITGLPFAN